MSMVREIPAVRDSGGREFKVVTGGGGWFLAGKSDQFRRDLEFDAGHQAFRALGRLLLAEADDELARLRTRIVAAVGPNAGLLTAVLPEFAAQADELDQAKDERLAGAKAAALARRAPARTLSEPYAVPALPSA